MGPGRLITAGAVLLSVAVGAIGLGGCAAPVARRDVGLNQGNQGGSSEVVFAGETQAGAEYGRRDELVLTHAGEGYDPPDAWPDEGRERLDDLRFVYLPRNARD